MSTITLLVPLLGDPAALQRLHIEYVCRLHHLGRTTATAEQIVIATAPTPQVASNTSVYTAADGGQLFSTWTGTATFDPGTLRVAFRGPETYTGGTARFADASGSAFISPSIASPWRSTCGSSSPSELPPSRPRSPRPPCCPQASPRWPRLCPA